MQKTEDYFLERTALVARRDEDVIRMNACKDRKIRVFLQPSVYPVNR
jgi:hypothetical protein